MSKVVIDLGTAGLKLLRVNDKQESSVLTDSYQFKRMRPTAIAQNYPSLLKAALQELEKPWNLKGAAIDLLISSGLTPIVTNQSNIQADSITVERVDPLNKHQYCTHISLDDKLIRGINRCFEGIATEIEFLGSSVLALIELICRSKSQELNLLCHLGNSSLVLALIREDTLLDYKEIDTVSGFLLDQCLMKEEFPSVKDSSQAKEKYPIFLPIQDSIHQSQIPSFQVLFPFLEELNSVLTSHIVNLETKFGDSLDQVLLSGGGFRIKSFDRYLEAQVDRSVDYFSHTFLDSELDILSYSVDSYSDFAPLMSHVLLENGLESEKSK